MNEHRPSLTRTEHRLSVEGGIRRLSGVAPGTVCAGIIRCGGSSSVIQLESGSTRRWSLVMWQPLFDTTSYLSYSPGTDYPYYDDGYFYFNSDYTYLNRYYTGKDLMWAVIPSVGTYPNYEYLTGTMSPTITYGATGLFVATDIKADMNLTGVAGLSTPPYGSTSVDYEIGSTVWALSTGI